MEASANRDGSAAIFAPLHFSVSVCIFAKFSHQFYSLFRTNPTIPVAILWREILPIWILVVCSCRSHKPQFQYMYLLGQSRSIRKTLIPNRWEAARAFPLSRPWLLGHNGSIRFFHRPFHYFTSSKKRAACVAAVVTVEPQVSSVPRHSARTAFTPTQHYLHGSGRGQARPARPGSLSPAPLTQNPRHASRGSGWAAGCSPPVPPYSVTFPTAVSPDALSATQR